MLRFDEIHDRFLGGRLSASEAAEWLGVSERTFRRQRVRFEEDGSDGLLDRRLGKASPHRGGSYHPSTAYFTEKRAQGLSPQVGYAARPPGQTRRGNPLGKSAGENFREAPPTRQSR